MKSRIALLAALTIGIVLLLGTVLAVELRRSYQREVENAEALTASIASLLEKELLASIGKIDLIVQESQYYYEEYLNGAGEPAGGMNPTLGRLLGRVPGILSLRLVNEDGNYLFDAGGRASTVNISDRLYFRIHKSREAKGLFVEGPILSRIVNSWTLVFSRGVHDQQGRFRGIVQSSIPMGWLATAFKGVRMGGDDTVALMNSDLVLIFRVPEAPALMGKPLPADKMRELIKLSPEQGTYTTASSVDGVTRIYSYRRIAGFPLYILSGVSQEQVLAQWRRTAVIYSVIALVLFVGGVVLVLNICRSVQKSRSRQELRYKELLRTSTDGIHILDAEGNLREASDSFYRMLGYDPANAGKMNALDWDEEFRPAVCAALINTYINSGATFETRHRRRDGTVKDVEISVRGISMAGDQLLYCSARDITERKLAETRLRDSEERFRKLFEDTRQAVTLLENGRYVAANRASLVLLGMERLEQFLGLSPLDISPEYQPDGRCSAEKIVQLLRIAFEKGSNEFEWEHLRADGAQFTAKLLLTPIRQGDKDLLHVVWSDITAQKKAVRELAESRRDLERRVVERTAQLAAMTQSLRAVNEEQSAIFDSASVGIVFVRNRLFIRCNRTMERIFGYDPDEMLGKSSRIWYTDDAAFDRVGQSIAAGLEQQGFYSEELKLQRKDGSRFWARLTAQAIDRHDLDKGIAGTIEDITTQRAALAEKERARALAEEAARTKSNFLANMSHEIRTPMNAIIGMSYLALRTGPTPQQRNYLLKIQSSSKQLLNILNDILDFSKIDAGKMNIEQLNFDVEKVLNDVTTLVVEGIAQKGLELIIQVEETVPRHLLGDPLRIGQILVNYANNAVKFTQQGEIAISVRVEARVDDELLIRFSVRDTGIGIEESQRLTLFQSFQQADNSTTRRYGGTGLGLVIAKRLVELMGGEVGVESTPGVGSTFWFTARLGEGEVSDKFHLLTSDLQGRRMLVVDDNEAARVAIGEMLRNMTFVVTAVDSGTAALAELVRADSDGEPYDVVFLDWQMPVMDGIATAAEIHRLTLQPPPLLLMLTAYGMEEVLQGARQVGIRDILLKPVSPSQLFDTLMRVFGVHDAEQQSLKTKNGDALPDVTSIAGARVLLVEDNEINQEVATDLLHEALLEVDLATDGSVAFEKVREQRYDIVLMDMQMPVMDGLTATREIRKLPWLRELPIVAMTANAMSGDRERCLDAGMNDHLAKPIDPEKLWSALLKWIKPRPPSPFPSSPRPERATPDVELPQALAGIDITLGLTRVLGKRERYLSLLCKFLAGQRDAADTIRTALSVGERERAERLAHTAKGVAGNIGATRLQGYAAALEQGCRAQSPPEALELLLLRFEAALKEVTADLEEKLPHDQHCETVAVDWVKLQSICDRLEELLREDDATAAELLEENSQLLNSAFPEEFEQIEAAVNAFDFELALQLLVDAVAAEG